MKTLVLNCLLIILCYLSYSMPLNVYTVQCTCVSLHMYIIHVRCTQCLIVGGCMYMLYLISWMYRFLSLVVSILFYLFFQRFSFSFSANCRIVCKLKRKMELLHGRGFLLFDLISHYFFYDIFYLLLLLRNTSHVFFYLCSSCCLFFTRFSDFICLIESI